MTIPVTVELGNAANATATISAENVTLPTDKTLKVTVNGPFTATLVGTTDVTAHNTIKNGSTALESGYCQEFLTKLDNLHKGVNR